MASETDAPEQLTAREQEVRELLQLGLTDSQIADRLGISASGASYHVSEIIGKLGVRNRHEAAAWPNRPPWWATATAPVALFLRNVSPVLPIKPSTAAAAVAGGLFGAALASIGLIVFLLLRDGGGRVPQATISDGTIEIPGSAITALTNYTFTTDLVISGTVNFDGAVAEGDFTVNFDGAFQAPDLLEGTLRIGGSLGEVFLQVLQVPGRPAETEVIAIGGHVWWREPGGDWQPGIEEYEDRIAPLVVFRQFGTPFFYLEALQFDELVMPVTNPVEMVNDQRAYRVRLDKSAIVDLLPQGTALKRYPEDQEEHEPVYPGVIENAQQVLPRDFLVEVWFAEEGLHPLRIVIEYSTDDQDRADFFMGLESPMSLRLQMDITNPDAGVEIEPPFPIPTETPRPTTPPGELTGPAHCLYPAQVRCPPLLVAHGLRTGDWRSAMAHIGRIRERSLS